MKVAHHALRQRSGVEVLHLRVRKEISLEFGEQGFQNVAAATFLINTMLQMM